jgi:16S rRNA (guanine1207-N2)-methyltransferase
MSRAASSIFQAVVDLPGPADLKRRMPARTDDAPLETLFLPLLDGRVTWPADGGLFLRARDGWPLREREWPGLVCEQTFRPDADALAQAGFHVVTESSGTFPIVLMLPPRQRDEARALMARALASVNHGGRIIAAASNNEGARSIETDMERIAGPLQTASKNKCRVFWTQPLEGPADAALMSQWLDLDAPRPIAEGRFVSRPGVFAWDRIDVASELLAAHLPADLAGHAADLGAGFGFLSDELLSRCPGIKALDVYEAEHRALDLARTNLARFETQAKIQYFWHDVTRGLRRTYDVIVTNPPFHTGTAAERPDIGRRFICVAAESLHPGGRLWLVANRHLPYESVLTSSFGQVRTVAQQHGFKIIEAVKAGRA